jgi:hypothetical protein
VHQLRLASIIFLSQENFKNAPLPFSYVLFGTEVGPAVRAGVMFVRILE